MTDDRQNENTNRTLREIKDEVAQQMETLSGTIPDELRAVYENLKEYEATLKSREQSMQGALVNLVDDMSQTSQTLTETGSRLEGILEAAKDVAFIIVDRETDKIVEFSTGAEYIFGYQREEMLGDSMDFLCQSDLDGTCPMNDLNRARQIMRRKSGETFPAVYSTYPLKDNNEVHVATLVIALDVTRQVKAENEIKMVIESSPIPLLKVEKTDHGDIIRELNPEAVKMFGESALNTPVNDFITAKPEQEDGLEDMRGERCEVHTPDGVRQAIRTGHQPVDRIEIQAVMDVGVLLEAKEAAEDASRVKSDFLANISHEIRTPLNVLLGMLQLFEEFDLDDEANEMLAHATGAAKSLLALLNDILDFSVVEARAFALDEQEFNLREMVELVADPYKVEAGNKGVELSYTIGDAIPALLMGDARRLRQILFHVTGNAVKFTDSGTIHVSVNYESITENTGTIEISVTDTGIGMTEKQMANIFEPFRQVDGSRRRRHGGTGIGLALVNEFVAAMDGKIDIDSVPEQGTRFTVMVPIAKVNFPST
ncbi:ATP-binding protein [Pseudodesulfovibrio sp. zrk46]|uniref:PAS domain-containing sensor histidine kinase n=1 Tax=Pseudodesulfovibrio sp. zrk46 TaxID=2725288 RepID=UPI001448F90E|nr:ATP-binding protein [Pseudodesulfovibrio sp. zrk46]QJB55769.1 PAS domain S-box protein [Pseudodesulfovibrio sp. zrk46]